MNNILLVLVNLDNDSFFYGDDLLKEIEKYRENKNLDISLLTLYSNQEMYESRSKIKKLHRERNPFPKLVFSKTFTKNDGNLTSLYMTKFDKNKEYIYSYMMRYLSKFIDVGGILIFDENLKLPDEDLKKCFGEREYKVISKLEIKEENKTLKKLFF